MAVPSSGQLKLWGDIWDGELNGSQGQNSLHSASVYAGFSTPDAMSDFYGWSDVEPPSVSSQNAQSSGPGNIVAKGTVNSTGNENPERGFFLGTAWSSPSQNAYYSAGTGGAGEYTRNVTGLAQVTTYYYWAYACNSAGTSTGGRIGAGTNENAYSAQIANVPPSFTWINLWGEPSYAPSIAPYAACYQQYWVNPYSGQNKHMTSGTNSGNYNCCMQMQGGGAAVNATNRFNAGMDCTYRFWATIGDCRINYQSTLAPQTWFFQEGSVSGGGLYCSLASQGKFGVNLTGTPSNHPAHGTLQWTWGMQQNFRS